MAQVIEVQAAYRFRQAQTGDELGSYEIEWTNDFGPAALVKVPDGWTDREINARMCELERQGVIVRKPDGELWRHQLMLTKLWIEESVREWVSFNLNPSWEIGDWRERMGVNARTQERGQNGRGLRVLHGDTDIDAACIAFSDIRVTKGGPAGQTKDHGTHTASTVCGKYSAIPEAELFSYDMLPGAGGAGSEAEVVRGFDWLTERGQPGDIGTFSLGAPSISQSITQAVNRMRSKGIRVFCAAGNSGGTAPLGSPANAADWIIMSCDRTPNRSGFTDGPQWPNLGNRIYGIGDPIVAFFPGNRQGEAKGTSMATPTVASCAGLLSKAGIPIPAMLGVV
jgi:hypothetical protein